LRLTDVTERGVREIAALSIDPDVYDQIDVPSRIAAEPAPVQIGAPAVMLMDLPSWTMSADAQSGFVAAMQKPWPGSVALYVSPQTTAYQLRALASAPATLGATLDPLFSAPEGLIDYRARVRVRLPYGTLASADLLATFAGANLAAVRNEAGDWEIIQFLDATLVDAQTYELSRLLRGQFGTEGAMSDVLAAGAPFVLLDGAVSRVPLQDSDFKLALNWRYGPGNRDIGDPSYATSSFAYQGLGRRPLSPRTSRACVSPEISTSRGYAVRGRVATTGSFPRCRSEKTAKRMRSIFSTARRSSARSPWRWRMPSIQAPSRSLTSATRSRRFR